MSEIDTSLVPPELAKGGLLRASANQAFSCPITLLPEGEHVWSWFQAAETTHQAAGPTQPEAAQTIVGPMGSRGLGENWTTIAFLSKEALGLRLVPRAQFRFRECSFPKCGFSRV